MHIPDGIVPTEVAVAGYVVTAAVTAYSLRRINQQDDPQAGMPKAALLTSAFFVATWIHIPIPPTSVHLVLNGLVGVVLGWYAFPAILVGLFLQAIMFQHGGLTTLGLNAAMMGIPALVAYQLFRLRTRIAPENKTMTAIMAFLGGAGGLILAAAVMFTILVTTIPTNIDVEAERAAISALTVAHIPLALIEGAFAVLVIQFLLRVRPELVEK